MLSSIPSARTIDLFFSSSNVNSNTCEFWDQYYSLGNKAHKQKQFTKAISYFEKCIILCINILKEAPNTLHTKTLPCMLHQSSHNLAACHNASGHGLLAKKTLQELHEQLVRIACCGEQPRALRLDVLSSIDQSLFSLTSQLAYLNQVEEVHPIIIKTERVATTIAEQLLNVASPNW
jgi:tetratricopeptide (TPR) repeat protein